MATIGCALNHTFILLGCALDDEGKMQDTMRKRLEYALDIFRENPTANIIVSGGVPRNGNCEAQVMKDWLVEKLGITKILRLSVVQAILGEHY